jgi:hypothetical protein
MFRCQRTGSEIRNPLLFRNFETRLRWPQQDAFNPSLPGLSGDMPGPGWRCAWDLPARLLRERYLADHEPMRPRTLGSETGSLFVYRSWRDTKSFNRALRCTGATKTRFGRSVRTIFRNRYIPYFGSPPFLSCPSLFLSRRSMLRDPVGPCIYIPVMLPVGVCLSFTPYGGPPAFGISLPE